MGLLCIYLLMISVYIHLLIRWELEEGQVWWVFEEKVSLELLFYGLGVNLTYDFV